MRIALAVAIAVLAVALAVPFAGAAKKGKKGKNKPVTLSSGDINLTIPDRGPAVTDPVGVLDVPITAGKALKGKEIADVNVSVRLTATTEIAAIQAFLIAPDQTTTGLVFNTWSGLTVGTGAAGCGGAMLTFDDETPNEIGSGVAADQPDFVVQPYAGRVRPEGYPLATMDGGPARGRWVVRFVDVANAIGVNTVNCAQVVVKPRNKLP